MKRITLILIISFVIGLFPINIFAQFDYLDDMINDDESIYEIAQPQTEDNNIYSTAQTYTLKDIEITWSTDSYVPYDYPGRALPSVDGFVDVIVIINLYQGRPENLQYSWFVDKTFDESQSGYGKKNFRFGIARNSGEFHTVLVKIFDDGDTFYLEKSITIPIVEPEILIYASVKNSEFSELAKRAISVPSNRKSYFIAKPFFFSIKKATDLDYQWEISGQGSITASGTSANILAMTVPEKKDDKRETRGLSVSVGNGWAFPKQNAHKDIVMQIK